MSKKSTYIFAGAGVQANEIGVVATEVGRVDFQGLQESTGAQLDLDPIVMTLLTGATCLPSITSVDTLGRENEVRGLTITIIASLDHTSTAGEASQVENSLLLGEDGRDVSKNTKAGLETIK